MLCSLVHRLEQAFKPFGKSDIALGTSQAPGFFEIGLGESAMRTFYIATALCDFLGGPKAQQQISQRGARGIINPLLLGALLAEVHLLHLIANNLGEMHLGILLFANTTQHSGSL